jgi:hypothetical protein
MALSLGRLGMTLRFMCRCARVVGRVRRFSGSWRQWLSSYRTTSLNEQGELARRGVVEIRNRKNLCLCAVSPIEPQPFRPPLDGRAAAHDLLGFSVSRAPEVWPLFGCAPNRAKVHQSAPKRARGTPNIWLLFGFCRLSRGNLRGLSCVATCSGRNS